MHSHAQVVELADTLPWGGSARKSVRVRISPWAPQTLMTIFVSYLFLRSSRLANHPFTIIWQAVLLSPDSLFFANSINSGHAFFLDRLFVSLDVGHRPIWWLRDRRWDPCTADFFEGRIERPDRIFTYSTQGDLHYRLGRNLYWLSFESSKGQI